MSLPFTLLQLVGTIHYGDDIGKLERVKRKDYQRKTERAEKGQPSAKKTTTNKRF